MGLRIASVRRMFGFTQLDLANLLHLSASTVGMYEQGRRMPSICVLLAITQLFGVTLDYIITGKTISDWDKLVHLGHIKISKESSPF